MEKNLERFIGETIEVEITSLGSEVPRYLVGKLKEVSSADNPSKRTLVIFEDGKKDEKENRISVGFYTGRECISKIRHSNGTIYKNNTARIIYSQQGQISVSVVGISQMTSGESYSFE